MKNGPRCQNPQVDPPRPWTGNSHMAQTPNHRRGRAENRTSAVPSFLAVEAWRALVAYFKK